MPDKIANTLSREAAAGALAQGGAKGGTLGRILTRESPEKGGRNAPLLIFMTVS